MNEEIDRINECAYNLTDKRKEKIRCREHNLHSESFCSMAHYVEICVDVRVRVCMFAYSFVCVQIYSNVI